MEHISKTYTWLGEEITMDVSGLVKTRIQDFNDPSGWRKITLDLENFTTVKGEDQISLGKLYEDIFPEFTHIDESNGDIKLKLEEIQEFFPGTKLIFEIDPEDKYKKPKKKPIKTKTQDKKTPVPKDQSFTLTEKTLRKIIDTVKEELREEYKPKKDYEAPDIHNVIQKNKAGKIVGSYLNPAKAAKETGISSSSLSQCLKNRTKSAGGFLWEFIS